MLTLGIGDRPSLRIVCFGAHCDDIEIGCGGTLLSLIQSHPGLHVTWVVLSGGGGRHAESRSAAARLLQGAGSTELLLHDFPDGGLDAHRQDIKDRLRSAATGADLILTHHRRDAHQDHRTVAELSWQVCRHQAIWEYEIPKWDGDLGQPNLFVPLSDSIRQRKLDVLLGCFPSQQNKDWFTADTFNGLMRLRGIEAAAPGGFAEAFFATKILVEP